ncbi:3'-5' exonuclease [Salmonella enterica]|uniref:3'-5' exonuclease n=1 Tax=Salmonella enterica subsp. enterica serovar Tennessee TaxID=143221 RepID=A0A549JFU1_SALET|nr:3'-5' exonuclease [Salmonella enterica]EBC9987947.1 3'-5' exonuclease [Salmonella enterica subsp. enterica serovar Montevideo]EBZ0155805.1 3'-5' exonuclease [Salmonella enterica subsp. enterica serovar Kentucky]ECB2963668.1 3'-5' exonuclease [Salmonella enterica subsp. enterica serovar Oranienburg]ECI5353937.1 3'-5' exonuclease [Salmonella enterica subsp. enterica]ECY0607883.1 3'-5' exonuclease [Salmonella enterica subsp. enterica serovar Cerro]EDJ2236197.1 3'-5' exonuclease [Salmonella en
MSIIHKTISQRAKRWLDDDRLFIDTETTGLGDDAEIVEICIIDKNGFIMLNTLIKPTKPIPDEAIAIHGITNEMVAHAPTWKDVHGAVADLFFNYGFVIYNADYDTRLIRQSAELNGLWTDGLSSFMDEYSLCAMKLYAEYRGEPGKYHGYKWHKLVDAAAHEGVVVEGKAHRALADCKMTLGLVRALAKGGAK